MGTMHSVKPLLIACIGRTLTAAPLGRREDDVEIRRVPVLPRAGGLDPSRPTVVLLDRTLLASTGDERRVLDELAANAALVAARNARSAESERYHELTELTRVGVALSTERDLVTLLDMILSQARRL